MATFSWDIKRFRVFLGMGGPPLEVVAYSSKRFVPFQLKHYRVEGVLELIGGLAGVRSGAGWCQIRGAGGRDHISVATEI